MQISGQPNKVCFVSEMIITHTVSNHWTRFKAQDLYGSYSERFGEKVSAKDGQGHHSTRKEKTNNETRQLINWSFIYRPDVKNFLA